MLEPRHIRWFKRILTPIYTIYCTISITNQQVGLVNSIFPPVHVFLMNLLKRLNLITQKIKFPEMSII